ncbi:motility associated factor glycosyltransferase family protein [Desulfovirgula thermocuniculi]|uniref:motility associated factor glycosyltransferase family protein n=1 Tax=Desulfovirgula thermocuniculi TaxID=348842 RepID=UPI00146F9950|nr:6-hydroxymethylpterin diphosphokinase MptE-like protein [Desulfovirgula thermocuniculi]
MENIQHLEKYFPNISHALSKIPLPDGRYKFLAARSGELTVCAHHDGQEVYLHSRYDPVGEARRWIAANVDESYRQVVFYGFGCGYMVAALLERRPEVKISIYEPDSELFKAVLKQMPLAQILNPRNVEVLGVEVSPHTPEAFIAQVVPRITGETCFLVLPAYRRLFPDKVADFQKKFLDALEQHRYSLRFDSRAEVWWTLNSLLNFSWLLAAPSIFRKEGEFRGKPLVITAAGPSLEEEYEHLRQIYERRMAYIFAVGSAVHGLLAHGITPHAFCSYDPWPENERVFASLTRTDFPLIFGTSIFANTLRHHAGPKFYMTISQDTVSPFLLGTPKEEIIFDAPSIAVCVLQLAYRLGCHPVVLVGQDLAFPGERVYASGINFARSETLGNAEKEQCIKVPAVSGGEVLTSHSFERMRRSMEHHLRQLRGIKVFNTSRMGARIAGTVEKPLAEIITEFLEPDVANPFWYEGEYGRPDTDTVRRRVEELLAAAKTMWNILGEIWSALRKIEHDPVALGKVLRNYEKVRKELEALSENLFFNIVAKPMVRAEIEVYGKLAADIAMEKRISRKSELIIRYCGGLVSAAAERSAAAEFVLKGIAASLKE